MSVADTRTNLNIRIEIAAVQKDLDRWFES